MARVLVEQGWLEGQLEDLVTEDGQFYSFKGVPYAAPPVGTLRFKAPQPPLKWEGVRQAKHFGPICPQVDMLNGQLKPGDEDCLFLNVYTKELKPKNPQAVMVFIHGGGYKCGSGNDDEYGGDFLVQHGVVLVTINYRVDALGFLCMDTKEVPGNAGMKDQVAAFKWVKKNIAQFGGDPDNVTVFGESAGGAATTLHVLSPLSKGLFNRAISMSGSPIGGWTLPFESRRRAFIFGKHLGIYTDDADELLQKLQALPVEELVDVHPVVLQTEEAIDFVRAYYFVPVIEKDFGEEHFLTDEIEEALRKNKVNDVDIMIGYTDKEGASLVGMLPLMIDRYDKLPETLVPRKILMKCTTDVILQLSDKIRKRYFGTAQISEKIMNKVSAFYSITNVYYPTHRFARLLPKIKGRSRYFYQFSCFSGRNVFGRQGVPYGIVGAGHIDDVMYLFHGKQFNLPIEKNSKEFKMINQTCKLWTNFAKFGNPTPDDKFGVKWKQYDQETRHFLDIGETLTPGCGLHDDDVAFWQAVHDDADV